MKKKLSEFKRKETKQWNRQNNKGKTSGGWQSNKKKYFQVTLKTCVIM